MFDQSKMTILVQAAGGSGDWRMWHYVVADDDTLADVLTAGYFTPFVDQITTHSIVYVTAKTFVAQAVLLVKDRVVTAALMSSVEFGQEDAEQPHVQGVPNQADASMPVDDAAKPI